MMLTGRDDLFDDEVRHGLRHGLHPAQLRRLRSLIEERQRNSWDCGDLLLATFGPPGPPIVHDGSGERFERLGADLGVSGSWLASCRACAAAWPESERRPTVSWAVHRRLAAEPERFRLLAEFRAECARGNHVPSHRLLVDWLDAKRVTRPTIGRPPVDPATRVERLALRLDHEALARLVERLSAALALASVA